MMETERMKAFEERRCKLAGMNDEQLKQRFWELCHQVVEPLVEMARTHTSPSIERSVLLRMGIDSISAQGVVAKIHEAGLLGKGAGHVVLKISQVKDLDIRQAAALILEQPDLLKEVFAK